MFSHGWCEWGISLRHFLQGSQVTFRQVMDFTIHFEQPGPEHLSGLHST